jgi:hypothetical protein
MSDKPAYLEDLVLLVKAATHHPHAVDIFITAEKNWETLPDPIVKEIDQLYHHLLLFHKLSKIVVKTSIPNAQGRLTFILKHRESEPKAHLSYVLSLLSGNALKMSPIDDLKPHFGISKLLFDLLEFVVKNPSTTNVEYFELVNVIKEEMPKFVTCC